MKRSRPPKRPPSRFDLYEWCVQAPEIQARFLRALHGGSPRSLCEDFCGPASIARAWALLDPNNSGVGVDLDDEPIAHAMMRAREQGIDAARFRVIHADVLETMQRADVIAAFNFAVCELHERPSLIAYLRRVRQRLKNEGIFVCDTYGGHDAFVLGSSPRRVRTPIGTVICTWEQVEADFLDARVENAIHFQRPRSREMRDAFFYDWRLWSVMELCEAMDDAGFESTEVYLTYGAAIDGDGNPIPVAAAPGEADEDHYVAYVVGRLSA